MRAYATFGFKHRAISPSFAVFLSSTTRIRTLFRWPINICRCSSFCISFNKLINYYALFVMWLRNIRSSVYFVFDKRAFLFSVFDADFRLLNNNHCYRKCSIRNGFGCGLLTVCVLCLLWTKDYESEFLFLYYTKSADHRYHAWRRCTVRKTI